MLMYKKEFDEVRGGFVVDIRGDAICVASETIAICPNRDRARGRKAIRYEVVKRSRVKDSKGSSDV